MVALMAPAMLVMTALIVDSGFWIVGAAQMQIAADAAAMVPGNY